MYEITEWLERYEVNDKGQPAKPGDKLRVSPLEYIRSKVHGRSQGAGFARLQAVAGHRCYEVFGVFQKFLEISGSESGGNRGKLLNEKGEPATIEDLAFILRTTEKKIEFSLQVLTDKKVGWIKYNELQENLEIPEIPGNSGAFLNTTQHNSTQHNTTQHKRFGVFWKSYPKKVGKGAAKKSWEKINPDEELFEKILNAVRQQKKSEQWAKENGRYIPNPATWLNQERWEDQLNQAESIKERLKKL